MPLTRNLSPRIPSVLNRSNFSSPVCVVEDLVVEDHVDIETGQRVLSVAEARQTEARVFVTSIEFIEENVGAGEAFVSILGRVIDAVVVIPQRVHRFFDIAGAGMRGINSGIDVRIVMIVELTLLHRRNKESRHSRVACGRCVSGS